MGRPIRELPEQTQADLRRLSGMSDSQALNCFLAKLHDAGWGYQPAALALGIHRQSVRQRALSAPGDVAGLPVVPEVPRAPQRPARPELTAEERTELSALNGLAKNLRPEHGPDHENRIASEQLSALIDRLTKRGITYDQIGTVLGVGKMTVRARLKRHGYRSTNPAMTPYQGRRPATEGVPA